MKYISLAAHNNELVVINDMSMFTTHFCYSKKQRQDVIALIAPQADDIGDGDMPIPKFEMGDADVTEEDDI